MIKVTFTQKNKTLLNSLGGGGGGAYNKAGSECKMSWGAAPQSI